MLTRTNTNTTTTTSLIDDGDWWFIYEILTRLPVKTLFRLKTVCKEWCSLIEKDENFIDSHLRTRSLGRLFIVVPVPMIVEDFEDNRAPENEVYITADLMLFEDHNKGRGTTTTTTREVVVDTVREVDSYSYSVISKPVNGLVCLIDMEDYNSVSICNISTRQLSPWFQSTLLSEEEKYNGIPMLNDCRVNPHYQFGFDPTTNEHKVVSVWELCKGGFVCEVLTVPCHGIDGNSRWRRIKEAPQYKLACDAVYVNGVIYWSTLALANGEWGSNRPSICIVAFDVGIEKFRTINVSNFIVDQPRDHFKLGYSHWGYSSYYSYTGGNVTLLEVGGHLAMLIRINHSLFKMYTYEDDDDDDDYKEETGRTSIGSKRSSLSSKDKRWSEVSTMTLPFCLGEKNTVTFHSFVGSDDKIILTTCKRIPCGEEVGKKKCVSYYCYNWKKGIWTELEISGIPSSVPHLCTDRFFGTYFETLLPVYNGDALSLPPMVHSSRWL